MRALCSDMSFAEEFLFNPADFPASSKGEPCGEERLCLDFLGGPYVFEGLSQAQADAVMKRFPGLISQEQPGAASITTQVMKTTAEYFRPVDLAGWEAHFDFDYGEHLIRIAGLRCMALIELKPQLRAWLWTPDEADLVGLGVFENLFRVLLAYRLLDDGGVLLHSAGLHDSERAWLFIGRSGAGKSTISGLGRDAGLHILSDDMNAVFPEDGSYLCEQLPFAGTFGQTSWSGGRYPVTGIHVLQQDQQNHLKPLSPAKRLAMLMVCSPFINSDPFRQQQLVDNLIHLTANSQGGTLSFKLQGGFEQHLEET